MRISGWLAENSVFAIITSNKLWTTSSQAVWHGPRHRFQPWWRCQVTSLKNSAVVLCDFLCTYHAIYYEILPLAHFLIAKNISWQRSKNAKLYHNVWRRMESRSRIGTSTSARGSENGANSYWCTHHCHRPTAHWATFSPKVHVFDLLKSGVLSLRSLHSE